MSDMTFERMISQMPPSIYQSLKQAVSLRKWPDGRMLTAEQIELCMEAVMRYEHDNNVPEESRIGYLEQRTCGAGPGGPSSSAGVSEDMAGLARDASRD